MDRIQQDIANQLARVICLLITQQVDVSPCVQILLTYMDTIEFVMVHVPHPLYMPKITQDSAFLFVHLEALQILIIKGVWIYVLSNSMHILILIMPLFIESVSIYVLMDSMQMIMLRNVFQFVQIIPMEKISQISVFLIVH